MSDECASPDSYAELAEKYIALADRYVALKIERDRLVTHMRDVLGLSGALSSEITPPQQKLDAIARIARAALAAPRSAAHPHAQET